jgi:hypothetical protein
MMRFSWVFEGFLRNEHPLRAENVVQCRVLA